MATNVGTFLPCILNSKLTQLKRLRVEDLRDDSEEEEEEEEEEEKKEEGEDGTTSGASSEESAVVMTKRMRKSDQQVYIVSHTEMEAFFQLLGNGCPQYYYC